MTTFMYDVKFCKSSSLNSFYSARSSITPKAKMFPFQSCSQGFLASAYRSVLVDAIFFAACMEPWMMFA